MTKQFPYDLWISTGSDAGISFATVGKLAKDSSMMQGILLSLQSLMSTEVDVSNSQIMTGENEFVKFGTFTLAEEADDVVVQYVVKSEQARKLSKYDEQIVQELALAFCRFIILTPNFHQNLSAGKMISSNYVTKSFLKACTIAKQKISIPVNNRGVVEKVQKYLQIIEKDPIKFPTLVQLKNIDDWIGGDENSWDKGSIVSFKRQLLVQMVAQDLLYQILIDDPFIVLEYENPRYAIDEIRNLIENYLRKKDVQPLELIEEHLSKNLEKLVTKQLKALTIDEIHSANSFIAHNLAKEVIYSIAKTTPLLSLIDFRDIPLYSTIQKHISTITEVPHIGNIICDALIEDVSPLVLQGARLFYNQLIGPFAGRKLPNSIWNVIINFTYSILEEKKIKADKNKQPRTSIEVKRNIILDRISKLTVLQPNWIKELTKRFKETGIGQQLQVSNIEESVLFANALERAIITTLEKMIKDQMFNSTLGDIYKYMMNSFKTLAPKTVLVEILSNLTKDVIDKGYETASQMSLSASDLIGSAIDEGTVKAYVNSVPVQIKRSIFGRSNLRFDGRTISSTELLQKQGLTISISNKIIPLRELEKDAEFLIICFKNTKILRRAYAKAILRGMITAYLQQLFNFEDRVINRLDSLITVFNKEMVSKLTPAHRLREISDPFPIFPIISNIPQRFRGKDFHEKCQESWNIQAPRTHKVIQDILNGFSTLRTNDLNYKKKARRLYSRAIKELKDIRKRLLKNWNPLNNQMTKLVERWSKVVSVDLSAHLDTVNRNVDDWVGDIFKIQKLDYGRFTISIDQCQKEIVETLKQINPREIEELPKNFMEIAISILLYRRIPEYVIDESYNQMISGEKKVADAVLKAWSKSKSRSDFENNLYLNMRALGNTFTKRINSYGRLISTFFVQNDIELSSDKQGYYITLGRIPKEIYSTRMDILSLLQFPNVEPIEIEDDWEIRLYLEPEYKKQMDGYRDRLIVMSDVVGFTARIKFDEFTGPVIDGIKSVIPYLIENGEANVIDLSETIKEALFMLSEYPTQIVEKKNKK
ncbi:MAG: hypothetical protein H7645_02225 [Candidatus Heimdallarchaeota archaeon]|nr:hypothetical protein [Candidatus Heimdallarchaeota archaeon]MCK4769132.1 hypothetical protein [Candidatus Heimdallarchaeota archaeon]